MPKRILMAFFIFLLAIFSISSTSLAAAFQLGVGTRIENDQPTLDTANLNWWLSDHWALRGDYSWNTDTPGIAALYKVNPKGRAALYLGLGADGSSSKESHASSGQIGLIAGMEMNLSPKSRFSLMMEAQVIPNGTGNSPDTRLGLTINYKFPPPHTGENNFDPVNTELLAKLITLEANDEPFEGQVAVAAVVLNRTHRDDFPASIRKVIYQPGQFATASRLSSITPSDSALKAAKVAQRGSDPSHGALYFYNPATCSPRARRYIQRSHFQVTARIGNHVFFK